MDWIKCVDGKPDERYEGYDWVLVRFKEPDTDFVLIPRVAEFGRISQRWHIIDIEDNDSEYYRNLVAIEWSPIE